MTKKKWSDSDLLALGKEVHDLFPEDSRRTCSRYGVGYVNGEVTDLNYTACHMALMKKYDVGSNDRVLANSLVISNQVQTKYHYLEDGFDQENMEKYYNFLFHESVFKDCYVTKDPTRCVRDGIVVRTDKPANLVVAACIATRQAWEYDHISKSINRMIGFGIEPRKAHLAGHIIEVGSDGCYEHRNEGGHYAVYTREMGPKNFLKGVLDPDLGFNTMSYREARNYWGIPYMWGNGGGLEIPLDNKQKENTSDPFGYIKSLGRLGGKTLDVVKAVNRAFERIGL